jgi:outer membrane biosynthesis protein TonB
MRTGLVLFVFCGALTSAASLIVPARRVGGELPALPAIRVAWTEGAFELSVDPSGAVTKVRVLTATPDGPKLIQPALATWRFSAAKQDGHPVASHVLVSAVFRPPQLTNNPTIGSGARMIEAASDDVPKPLKTPVPPYPINAIDDAVVAVELEIDPDGSVYDARVVAGIPPFSDVAVDAARRWTFSPAHSDGQPVLAYAYLIFGFPRPVT